MVLSCDSSPDKLTIGADNNPSRAVRTTLTFRVHVMTLAHSAPYLLETVHSRINGCFVGPDSSVGIATRYGLDGPGIESRRGRRDLPHPYRLALDPTQPPIKWVSGLSHG